MTDPAATAILEGTVEQTPHFNKKTLALCALTVLVGGAAVYYFGSKRIAGSSDPEDVDDNNVTALPDSK